MSNREEESVALARLVREGQRYWAGAAGRAHWQAERACLGPVCERLHGGHRLELSMAPPLTDMSPIAHGLGWSPTVELATDPATLVCLPDALALPDGCLHLTLVHHLLEVVAEPHRLLQEAARVTADDGQLLILGWAPLGVAGLARLWPGHRQRLPWRGRWRQPTQLRDWLAFVDFRIEQVDYCGFHLPGGMPRNAQLETLGRRYNLPVGGSYIIRARRHRRVARIERPRLSFGGALGASPLGQASHVGRHSERGCEVD